MCKQYCVFQKLTLCVQLNSAVLQWPPVVWLSLYIAALSMIVMKVTYYYYYCSAVIFSN